MDKNIYKGVDLDKLGNKLAEEFGNLIRDILEGKVSFSELMPVYQKKK